MTTEEEIQKAIIESKEIFERMMKFFKEMEDIHEKHYPNTVTD